MPSLENLCEQVIKEVLSASGTLAAFAVVQRDEDSAANKDRIVVSAQPREVDTYGKNQEEVFAYRILCDVELFYVTRSEAVYDTDIAAIEAALGASTFPAPALATVTGNFERLTIEQTSDGNADTADNTRNRARTFRCIARPL